MRLSLCNGLVPILRRRQPARITLDALQSLGIDFRPHVVQHQRRQRGRDGRRAIIMASRPPIEVPMMAAPLRINAIDQSEDVLKVDRRLIVLRIGIARGPAAAAHIGNDDPIAAAADAARDLRSRGCCASSHADTARSARRLGARDKLARIELQPVVADPRISLCRMWPSLGLLGGKVAAQRHASSQIRAARR